MVGESLGHYRILEEIGSGGMGRVYRARDEHLNRDVAIKVRSRHGLRDETAPKRFRSEAHALSKLNHPCIATVHDFDRQDGIDFLVMEHVEGSTLRELLAPGPLTERDLLAIGVQIADALEEAHAHGIVHRDLKPENIMVTPKGLVKVLDFGLAKLRPELLDDAMATSSTDTQLLVGTVPYMAPEQVRGERVDARTDIDALGAILYEMATGHRAFPQEQLGRLMDAILHVAPEPPSRLNPGLSEELQRTISTCLEKESRKRYQTAAEVASELRRMASPTSPAAPSKPPGAARMRRTLSRAILLFGIGVGIALLPAVWVAYGPERSPPGEKRSVAVLPFVDMSAEKGQEFFSDGLAEELRDELGRIPGLRVVGRTSSFQFKGKTEDVRAMGEKLNVSTIVEGSVRRDSNRVRIAAQLVDARDGFQLWSGTYDRALNDVFAVQDEIARAVAGALELQLLGGAGSARTEDTEAYTSYLKGRYFYSRQTREDLEKAATWFQEALAHDPAHAKAWTGLAATRAHQAGTGYIPAEEGFAEARRAIERALALDANYPRAHAVKGWLHMAYDWDWARAEEHFRRASELQPGIGSIEAAQLATALGRFDVASAMADEAVEHDPLSSQAQFTRSLVAFYAGRLEVANVRFRSVLEINPRFPNAHAMLGQIRLIQGRPLEALTEFEQEDDPYWRLPGQALTFHALGRADESDASLSRFVDDYQEVAAYQIAQIHAFRGDTERALEWLERAYSQTDLGLIFTNVDPLLRGLQPHTRFAAFTKKMKLRS